MDYWKILMVLTAVWSISKCFPHHCKDVKLGTCEMRNENHLVCVGTSPLWNHTDISQNVTNLTLCVWPYRTFKVDKHLGHLQGLMHLLLTHSAVQQLESFSHLQQLQTVNLTRLQVKHLDKDVFSGLSHLTSVDIRHNHLSALNSSIFSGLPALQQIFLSGNNWTCDPGLLWIIANESSSVGVKVQDRVELICEFRSKTWPKPLIQVMKLIQVMQMQCPPPCNCSMDSVVRAYTNLVTERGKLLPHIKVNCNRRNLRAMPAHLPDYTTYLYLQGNNLTTVEEIVFNEVYKDVREINLENNQITSINILEGSNWLKNDRPIFLNLRGNQLKQIPLYALDNAFHGNYPARLFLGNNPWRCDCEFTIHFRDFIKKYQRKIIDREDIRCEAISGEENANKMILELTRRDLCRSEDSVKLTFLDKLNIFLASMNLLVISVFLFNLTVYRTTGRLPWMVAKLF